MPLVVFCRISDAMELNLLVAELDKRGFIQHNGKNVVPHRINDVPSFEVYDRKSKPVPTQPLVTLQASGTFSMNRPAYEALGSPDAVDLLYDRGEKIVGFRTSDPESPRSYPIRPQPNSLNFQTGGRAFCTYFNIPTGKARRFAAEMIGDVLAVDLKEEPLAVGRRTHEAFRKATEAE